MIPALVLLLATAVHIRVHRHVAADDPIRHPTPMNSCDCYLEADDRYHARCRSLHHYLWLPETWATAQEAERAAGSWLTQELGQVTVDQLRSEQKANGK